MWCESAQRDCPYLDVVKGLQDTSVVAGAFSEHEVEVSLDEAVTEVTAELLETRTDFDCTDDYCLLLGKALHRALLNEAHSRSELKALERERNTRKGRIWQIRKQH
jgi:hypothetical protein